MLMASCWVSTGKCTFQTIRCFTKNFISRLAISVFILGRPNMESWVFWSVGINGIRKQLGSPHCEVQKFFSIRRQSGGIPQKRSNTENANTFLGRPSKEGMQLPTDATLRYRIGLGTRHQTAV